MVPLRFLSFYSTGKSYILQDGNVIWISIQVRQQAAYGIFVIPVSYDAGCGEGEGEMFGL